MPALITDDSEVSRCPEYWVQEVDTSRERKVGAAQDR